MLSQSLTDFTISDDLQSGQIFDFCDFFFLYVFSTYKKKRRYLYSNILKNNKLKRLYLGVELIDL